MWFCKSRFSPAPPWPNKNKNYWKTTCGNSKAPAIRHLLCFSNKINWKNIKLQWKHFENALKPIGWDLLKVNGIAKGHPCENQLTYYKITWETLKPNENLMKMHEKTTNSDLLKFNEIAKGYPYENKLWYYKRNRATCGCASCQTDSICLGAFLLHSWIFTPQVCNWLGAGVVQAPWAVLGKWSARANVQHTWCMTCTGCMQHMGRTKHSTCSLWGLKWLGIFEMFWRFFCLGHSAPSAARHTGGGRCANTSGGRGSRRQQPPYSIHNAWGAQGPCNIWNAHGTWHVHY